MKTIVKLTIGRKMQQLAVVLICVTLVGLGWAAKVRMDELARISDALEKDLTQPPELYLWRDAKQKAAAKERQSSPKIESKETPALSAPISKAN